MNKYNSSMVIVTDDGTIFEVAQLKKYNIKDVVGTKFHSKMEAEYYLHLRQLEKIGQLKILELQPKFILQDKPKITYIADFLIQYPSGLQDIRDVKGMQTQTFRLKMKMFRARYPVTKLTLVTRQGIHWKLREVG